MPKIIEDEQVFDAVIGVITELGYSGATTKLMSEAADISEITLFRKYGSKQELVNRAISYVLSKSDLQNSIQYTGNLYEDLKRFVSIYETTIEQKGDFISTIVIEVYRNPELRDLILKPIGVFKQFASLISRYQQEGVLRDEPPMMTVASLLGPLMYKNMISKIIMKRNDIDQEIEKYVTNFLQGRENRKSNQ